MAVYLCAAASYSSDRSRPHHPYRKYGSVCAVEWSEVKSLFLACGSAIWNMFDVTADAGKHCLSGVSPYHCKPPFNVWGINKVFCCIDREDRGCCRYHRASLQISPHSASLCMSTCILQKSGSNGLKIFDT